MRSRPASPVPGSTRAGSGDVADPARRTAQARRRSAYSCLQRILLPTVGPSQTDEATWAMANGFKRYRSGAVAYDPKLHLRFELEPLDLYVRHVSNALNAMLKRVLFLLEPVRYDPVLPKFPNYDELWGARAEPVRVEGGPSESPNSLNSQQRERARRDRAHQGNRRRAPHEADLPLSVRRLRRP